MLQSIAHTTEIEVKFSEADPLGIVWHGHHIRYFEDGREAFGSAYGIRYLDLYRHDIIVPMISVHCDYKRVLRYSQKVALETIYIDTPAAKLLFEYRMTHIDSGKLVATGSSTQVFMEKDTFELMLTIPPFMKDWKQKWLA